MKEPFKFSYTPIAGINSGYTALTIYPPGTWMNNTDYVTFVGGNGVGRVESLHDAKELLHKRAVQECDYRIAEAEKVVDHYKMERSRLVNRGLTNELKEKV